MGGRLFKSVTGLGSYSVALNGNSPPMFNTNSAPIIEHREYLADVVGSTSFAINSYDINPGLVSSFPWLAGVASAFEEYRLLGCIYEFKSTSASALNSTNTAMGTVIMATEYDVSDAVFSSKLVMENHQFAVSTKPDLSCLHPVECAPALTVAPQRWVRSSAVPSGADPKLYDWGRMSIATTGMQAVNVIGELWVTYRVQLLKPQLLSGSSASNDFLYVGKSSPTGNTDLLHDVLVDPYTTWPNVTNSTEILLNNCVVGQKLLIVVKIDTNVEGGGVTPGEIELLSSSTGITAFTMIPDESSYVYQVQAPYYTVALPSTVMKVLTVEVTATTVVLQMTSGNGSFTGSTTADLTIIVTPIIPANLITRRSNNVYKLLADMQQKITKLEHRKEEDEKYIFPSVKLVADYKK